MANENIQELKFQVGEAWKGVYSPSTAYGLANVVQDPTGLSIYRSLKSGNVGHPLSNASWWFRIIDLSSIKAESDRIAALNQAIAQDEALRVAAEELRQQHEAERVAAETQRNEAEQQRISAEQARVNAESARATAEQQRITAEQGRVSAESARVQAEQARVLAETLRANAEDQRAANEQNRIAAEQQRIERAEQDHQRAESDHATYVDSLGAFDISSYHATDGVLAKYADLTAALGTNGANIPDDLRKGGMSVKFVQSSDNKYVQCRLMADSFTTDVTQWQGVDSEPIIGSHNLVESGNVGKEVGYFKRTSENTKNLFDPTYLMSIAGWTETEAGVISGTLSSLQTNFSANNKSYPIIGGFKENTRYCISLEGKNTDSGVTGFGIIISILYTDNTAAGVVSLPNSTTDWTSTSGITAANKTVAAIRLSYGSDGNHVWNLRNIQIEEGTSKSSFVPFIQAVDFFAREKVENLEDSIEDVANSTNETYNRLPQTPGNKIIPDTDTGLVKDYVVFKDGKKAYNVSYGYCQPILLSGHHTIMLNDGNDIYWGDSVAVVYQCEQDGTFIKQLLGVNRNKTEPASYCNSSDSAIYVGICAKRIDINYRIITDDSCAGEEELVRSCILSESFTVSSITRNSDGNVTAANIVYPDGKTGSLSITRNSNGDATSMIAVYDSSSYTMTITRDNNGNVLKTNLIKN